MGGAVAAWAALLVGLFLPGCATWGTPDFAFDSDEGGPQSVAIRYRVDAQKQRLPVAVARIEGQLVSYETHSATNETTDSLGVLEIIYPHPHGRSGYALARVNVGEEVHDDRLSGSKSGWLGLVGAGKDAKDVAGHESWELDISKSEMDQLIARLRQSQFFGPTEYSSSGVKLTTRLDGEKTTKSWSQIPEYDALIQRVRHDGLLVSYRRNEALDGGDDERAHGWARLVRPLLNAATVGAAPKKDIDDTPVQYRAGSRFAPGVVRTITRVPKKQPAERRLRRLPAVDPMVTP